MQSERRFPNLSCERALGSNFPFASPLAPSDPARAAPDEARLARGVAFMARIAAVAGANAAREPGLVGRGAGRVRWRQGRCKGEI